MSSTPTNQAQQLENPPESSTQISGKHLSADELARFTIEKSRFGLYTSIAPDGTRMVTGMTEESVDWATKNIHIPHLLGTFDGVTSKGRSSVVDGKL